MKVPFNTVVFAVGGTMVGRAADEIAIRGVDGDGSTWKYDINK